MSFDELLRAHNKLKDELAERVAELKDRDAQIKRLASDLRTLETLVKRLLAGRRGSPWIAEGQGVLFPDTPASDQAPDDAPAEPADETPDGEEAEQPEDRGKGRKPRKPGTGSIDTSALRRIDHIHELPDWRVPSSLMRRAFRS